MKDLNSLETALRQWKPRPPSAALEARLFGEGPADEAPSFSLIDAWRWLIPAMGCFMLAFASLNPHPSSFRSLATNNAFQAVSLGSPLAATFVTADSHSEMNSLPHRTLEWTFGETRRAPVSALFSALDTNKGPTR